MSPGQLATECGADIVVALIAAFLLSSAAGKLTSFVSRVLFVTLLGLIGFTDIHASYWNWYGFPADYTAWVLADMVIGYALVGVVLALFAKKETR